MKMNDYLSMKLKILSFISIVMVIFVHMYYVEGESYVVLRKIEQLIGQRICLIAVPLFYIISGYLFFLKTSKGIYSFQDKLKKRIKTLLVPYIIANIFTFIFYSILNVIALNVPYVGSFVNFKVLDIVVTGLWPTLKLIFIEPPIAFQLWFVRDLMLIMLFSPVIWWGLRFICKGIVGNILGVLLFLLLLYKSSNGYILALLWFSLGGYLAIHPKISLVKLNCFKTGFFSLFAWLLLVLYPANMSLSFGAIRLIPVFGIPALWILFDYLSLEKFMNKRIVQEMCAYTFFIYLVHEPLLNIFKKLPLLISHSELTLIISYLIMPIVFVLIFCRVGYLLKKSFPKLYSIYTGGR